MKGKNVVVLCVEKKSVPKLQEERTVRKICLLDDHVLMAFAGKLTFLFNCLPVMLETDLHDKMLK